MAAPRAGVAAATAVVVMAAAAVAMEVAVATEAEAVAVAIGAPAPRVGRTAAMAEAVVLRAVAVPPRMPLKRGAPAGVAPVVVVVVSTAVVAITAAPKSEARSALG